MWRHSGFGSMCCKQAARGRSALRWCELSEVSVEASEPLGESRQRCTYAPSLNSEAGWNVIATAERYLCLVCPAIQRSEKTASKTCVYCLCQEVSKQGFFLTSDALRCAVRKLREVIIVPSLQARTERVQNKITFLDRKINNLAFSHQLQSLQSWHWMKNKK